MTAKEVFDILQGEKISRDEIVASIALRAEADAARGLRVKYLKLAKQADEWHALVQEQCSHPHITDDGDCIVCSMNSWPDPFEMREDEPK